MKSSSSIARRARVAALILPAALALTSVAASAKTLVYCSEGSPENFYPGVNTTGTSFDVTTQVYDTIVQFERGGIAIVHDANHEDRSVAVFRAPSQGTASA